MQQLNLDWILSKLKTLLRLVPDDGTVGQILRRTRDGAVWSDEQGGGGGGAVESVNGKTGAVVLDATDVGALPDDYTPPVTSVNGKTGAVVLGKSDVGLANVDNVKQYSATNPPPYPVTSVNGQTGAVVIPTGGAVDSVNGQTGAVVLDAADVGALPNVLYPTTFHEAVTQTNNGVIEKTLTVAGTGFLIISNSIQSDSTADTGAVRAIIDVNNVRLAYNQNNMDNARAYPIGASCSAAALVNDGDTILLSTTGTKNGTKTIYRHILCFGCTVS